MLFSVYIIHSFYFNIDILLKVRTYVQITHLLIKRT